MKNSDLLWKHLASEPDDTEAKLALVDCLTDENDIELAETVRWAVNEGAWPSNSTSISLTKGEGNEHYWVAKDEHRTDSYPWIIPSVFGPFVIGFPDTDKEAILQLRDALLALNLIGVAH